MRMAFRALTRNKARSILTMLGVIIGVGAVIAMMGIGQGADQQVQSQLANLGSKPSLCQLRFHEPRRPEIRVGSYKDAGAG